MSVWVIGQFSIMCPSQSIASLQIWNSPNMLMQSSCRFKFWAILNEIFAKTNWWPTKNDTFLQTLVNTVRKATESLRNPKEKAIPLGEYKGRPIQYPANGRGVMSRRRLLYFRRNWRVGSAVVVSWSQRMRACSSETNNSLVELKYFRTNTKEPFKTTLRLRRGTTGWNNWGDLFNNFQVQFTLWRVRIFVLVFFTATLWVFPMAYKTHMSYPNPNVTQLRCYSTDLLWVNEHMKELSL